LADPVPVLQTTMAHPYLVMRYRLDGVIAVVDAVNGAATLDEHMEAVKQVAVADRIVLTKTDLLAAPEGRRRRDALAARLELLRSVHGPNLLRLKGIVKLAETPASPLVIHGVQHIFHPAVRLPHWPD